ncbi:MAG TPA: DUF4291 family protein [Streptomyces sp.]|nr:DUF4291 family protein [Streptomyces sp.]
MVTVTEPEYRIRAVHTASTVTVYQAYAPEIGLPAARDGRFPATWKRDRLTRITTPRPRPRAVWRPAEGVSSVSEAGLCGALHGADPQDAGEPAWHDPGFRCPGDQPWRRSVVMDEGESLHRYGLRPAGASLDEVRGLLTVQTRLEQGTQGGGDTELMKLCCVQLFNSGALEDVLLIWKAKTASMDADCSIDIRVLCGSGLARTKAYLASQHLPEAEAALRRLLDAEEAGEFEDFSVEGHSAHCAAYYAS